MRIVLILFFLIMSAIYAEACRTPCMDAYTRCKNMCRPIRYNASMHMKHCEKKYDYCISKCSQDVRTGFETLEAWRGVWPFSLLFD